MVMPHNERVERAQCITMALSRSARSHGRLPQVTVGSPTFTFARQGRSRTADPNDLVFLLKGMQNTWQEVWRQRLGQAERAYTSELRDFRNTWAHQGQF